MSFFVPLREPTAASARFGAMNISSGDGNGSGGSGGMSTLSGSPRKQSKFGIDSLSGARLHELMVNLDEESAADAPVAGDAMDATNDATDVANMVSQVRIDFVK